MFLCINLSSSSCFTRLVELFSFNVIKLHVFTFQGQILFGKKNTTKKVLWNWYHQHARVFDWQNICYVWWTVGIPLGTNCAPLLADLFLYSYEADFILGLRRKTIWSYNFTFRYIDDVLSLSNSRFGDFVDWVYPLSLK